MLSQLISILETQNNLSDWKIKVVEQKGYEIFFVHSKIDMTRAKEVTHYNLMLYKNFIKGESYTGSSLVSISPGMTSVEIKKLINQGLENASFVKNQSYPILEPTQVKSKIKNINEIENKPSLSAILKEIQSLDPKTKEALNSMELFIYEEKKTIVNSRGIHVTSVMPKIYQETITQAKGLEEDVELYFENHYSTIKPGQISKQIQEMVIQTIDRSKAVTTPNLGKFPIILSGTSVVEFFNYYVSKSSARAFYEKLSPFKPNDSIMGKEVRGDMVDLWLEPLLDGSYYSCPFDEDGYPLETIKVIDKGFLIRHWGDLRYSHYVDAVSPTGGLNNFRVAAGQKTLSQLKEKPYVEIVSFSDFQMDTMTGDIGGEIRLGYYFDGTTTVPITKGSIVGNIIECQNNLTLSQEVHSIMNFCGPQSILLQDAMVSGS